jgi:hypothetical protein
MGRQAEGQMPRATVQAETIAGVPGTRFTTDARPGTVWEERLQEIQSELSGGVVLLSSETTLPHLALVSIAVVDGPPYSVISLWVPDDKRSEAARLLEAAGFALS